MSRAASFSRSRARAPRVRRVTLFALAAASALLACGSDPERVCSDDAPLTVCATGATVKGIDVSVYQGTVDWPKAAASGIAFAFARVSDGLHSPDSYFAINWKGMQAAGVVRGAYQFFRPAQDPAAQADMALAAIAAAGPLQAGDLPLVLDVEVVDGVDNATLRANVQTWLDRVEKATGRAPILYTAPFMAQAIGNGFAKYTLWVANYQVSCPTMPASWTKWMFWQTSGSGSAEGVTGAVDLDVFNGTLADLHAFAHPPVDAGADAAADADASADGGSVFVPDASGLDASLPIGAGSPHADAGNFADAPCR